MASPFRYLSQKYFNFHRKLFILYTFIYKILTAQSGHMASHVMNN